MSRCLGALVLLPSIPAAGLRKVVVVAFDFILAASKAA